MLNSLGGEESKSCQPFRLTVTLSLFAGNIIYGKPKDLSKNKSEKRKFSKGSTLKTYCTELSVSFSYIKQINTQILEEEPTRIISTTKKR